MRRNHFGLIVLTAADAALRAARAGRGRGRLVNGRIENGRQSLGLA